MDKKIIIAIIAVIAIVLGVYAYMNFGPSNTVKVGESTTIEVPAGFQFDKINKDKTYLKNDATVISIKENVNAEPLEDIIKSYNETYSEKYTVETGNKTVGDVPVVWGSQKDGDKLVAYDYWYIKNDKTYHICVTKENNEEAVDAIIKSTK